MSTITRKIIGDPDNTICLSIVSLWEIAIKINIGKLLLSSPLAEIIKNLDLMDINLLQIESQHILCLEKLEIIHRDPFDRLIISQAIVEDLTIISADEIFPSYPVKVIW